MYLHNWLTQLFGADAEYRWVFHGAIVFLIAMLAYWLKRSIINRLLVRFHASDRVWDDSLLQALSLPITLLIWVFALTLFGEYALLDFHQNNWSKDLVRVRTGSAVLISIWFLWRYITELEHRLMSRSDPERSLDKTTVSVIGRFLRIGLVVVGLLILLQSLGFPLTGLLAFGGGGAIIMGIAAQQLLANWFGGLMIFLDKPFKLGDWIQSPDKSIEGKVARIGWRTTKVMAFDNRPLYIPNALFNQIVIVNPQRMTHRRINLTFGLRYQDAPVIKGLVKAIEDMLRAHPNIDRDEDLMAHLMNFGPSTLDINVYCFTKTVRNPHWRNLQQEVFFKIIELVKEHNADFAFPTVTTHIPDGVSIQGDLRP